MTPLVKATSLASRSTSGSIAVSSSRVSAIRNDSDGLCSSSSLVRASCWPAVPIRRMMVFMRVCSCLDGSAAVAGDGADMACGGRSCERAEQVAGQFLPWRDLDDTVIGVARGFLGGPDVFLPG